MWEWVADGFINLVIGAVIAGLIGLLAVGAAQWLRRRQYVKDNILAPVYDFVMDLIKKTDRTPGVDPWPKFSWSEQKKVSARFKKAIQPLSDAWEEFLQAERAFLHRIHDAPKEELVKRLAGALSTGNHLDSQGRLALGPFGTVGGATMEVSELLDNILRPIIRHLDDPKLAWDEIEASEKVGKDLTIVGTLRKSHPETLERTHGKLESHPAIAEARPLLEVADKKRALALQRGEKLRQFLERKL